MLWSNITSYIDDPFENEVDLERAILECSEAIFGKHRIYLDPKKKIGIKGKTRNIPDGYLLDLASTRDPKLYVVENELVKHDPLKHIAVQILEFSLSFETTPHTVKSIVKEAIVASEEALSACQTYASSNGFENVDFLLERMIYGPERFNSLVIIDDLPEELEHVLISRFKFPVEILTIQRYRSASGDRIYRFDPFLIDVIPPASGTLGAGALPPLDPSDLDTIVVPAHDDGFQDTFIGENRWYAIRIHSSMIPKIKYIAVYRVQPQSAITHIAPVASIEQWDESSKYVLNFAVPAEPLGPIRLVSNGVVKAPYGPRYTSRERLVNAKSLEDAF